MIGLWTQEWLESNHYPHHYLTQTTSTNSVAKENAMAEKEAFVVYLADEQSEGRGQGQNKWLNSKAGSNLLMTCSLSCSKPPQPELCLLFGEHLKKACERTWKGLPWRIKPPNDIYIESKKVGGILLESVSQGDQHRLLFGLGFNSLDYPDSDSFAATSLQKEIHRPLTKMEWHQFLNFLFEAIVKEPLFRGGRTPP